MIRDIIAYPTPMGVEYAPDVRFFDEELFAFIDDLKETVIANSLSGLAAPQVGSYYNVVVVKKDDGSFLELINPRVINTNGKVISTETTAYFPNISFDINRYKIISLVYQDRDGQQQSLKADGDFSLLLQRKIDYLFGGTLLNKLPEKERSKYELRIKKNITDADMISCPTTPRKFSRDYFIKAANYIMIAMALVLGVSLFLSDDKLLSNIWQYQLYFSYITLGVSILYTIYSYYENKKFSVCTNCYNMSIFGVVVITLFRLTVIMILSYFFIKP